MIDEEDAIELETWQEALKRDSVRSRSGQKSHYLDHQSTGSQNCKAEYYAPREVIRIGLWSSSTFPRVRILQTCTLRYIVDSTDGPIKKAWNGRRSEFHSDTVLRHISASRECVELNETDADTHAELSILLIMEACVTICTIPPKGTKLHRSNHFH
jgi:hypothetical protein